MLNNKTKAQKNIYFLFSLYNIQKVANLIYSYKHQMLIALGKGNAWDGPWVGFWAAGNVLYLDLGNVYVGMLLGKGDYWRVDTFMYWHYTRNKNCIETNKQTREWVTRTDREPALQTNSESVPWGLGVWPYLSTLLLS